MKTIKRIVIWSIVAMMLQSFVYLIVDKYYEISLLNTKATEVRVEKQIERKKGVDINIPLDAVQVNVSYDAKYISYYENNELNIVNSFDGTKHVVSAEKNSQQVYCKWFPDINSIVICEKKLGQTGNKNINIFRYNADNNEKFAPTDTNNYDIKFALTNSKDKIEDIAMSSTMGLWYVKILKTNGKSDIRNIDVNGNVINIFNAKTIGDIGVFKHIPNLIYEDRGTNTVQIRNKKFNINNIKTCLLNTDDKDKLYIGILQNGKVTKVLYGSIDKAIEQWSPIELEAPIDKDKIIVTENGKLYIENSLEGYIVDKTSAKKTYFKGNLLRVTDYEVISVQEGKLQTVQF
jgi:hypothetical protein